MKRGVYITFDVECSMGGAWRNAELKPVPPARAIMGQYGGREYGLPLICAILKRHNLAGTFFLEPFLAEQGFPEAGREICQYLLEAGQDVQLHIHPNHKNYGLMRAGQQITRNDQMGQWPAERQYEFLAEGAQRLRAWTGRMPAAFRAGNLGASEETLAQMARAGLRIDSSYSFPYLGSQCLFQTREAYNGSRWYDSVLEMAFSGFRLGGPERPWAKPLDLVGISFAECRRAIEAIVAAGADAVLILHSFSLFKVKDLQYHGGKLNWVVKNRFEQLCAWLAAHREQYPVYTFSQLADGIAKGEYQAAVAAPPVLSLARALCRKAVQAVNRFYWV